MLRRWKPHLRFRLRTLLVGVAIVCLLLTALPFEARQYQQHKGRMRALITSLGGEVETLTYSDSPSPGANWLSEFLGYVEPRESLWRVSLAGTSVTASDLNKLNQCPWIRSMNLSNTNVGDDGLMQVVGLANLVELRLGNTKVTDSGIIRLEPLNSLVILDVAGTDVTYQSLAALETAIPGANLQEQLAIARARAASIVVDLGTRSPTPGAKFNRFASQRAVIASIEQDLTQLGLQPDAAGTIHITNPMILTKVHVEDLRRLISATSFSASGVQFPPGGLEFLIGLDNLQSVTIDDASTGNLRDDDLRSLARLPRLQSFVLYSPNITDAGIAHLAKASRLTSLSIGGTKFTENVLAALSNAGQLESLSVSASDLTPELVAPLNGLAGLRKLELNLWHRGRRSKPEAVSDDLTTDATTQTGWNFDRPPAEVIERARRSMLHLAGLPSLKELSLMGNLMVIEVLEPLKNISSLEWLKVDGRYVSHEEGRLLQLEMPRCHVQRIEH